MSADRTPDPANPYKARAIVLDSPAYVIRQLVPNGPWLIVDRSGPQRSGQGDRPWPDGADPMQVMEESAEQRQAFVEMLMPNAHVLFLAVAKGELREYGL